MSTGTACIEFCLLVSILSAIVHCPLLSIKSCESICRVSALMNCGNTPLFTDTYPALLGKSTTTVNVASSEGAGSAAKSDSWDGGAAAMWRISDDLQGDDQCPRVGGKLTLGPSLGLSHSVPRIVRRLSHSALRKLR